MKTVASGASLTCTMGAAPGTLTVLPVAMTNSSKMPMATIMDNKPMVNIGTFGMCQSIANPAVASATAAAMGVLTPMPCVPATAAPWVPGQPTVLVKGMPALDSTSKCMCMWAGTISITSPGTSNEKFKGGGGGGGSAGASASAGALSASRGAQQKSAVPGMAPAEAKATLDQALEKQKELITARKADLQKWGPAEKAAARKWFGSSSEETRKVLADRVDKMEKLNARYSADNFEAADPVDPDTYGYVYPNDDSKIYVDGAFESAPASGEDSKAGFLCHEMSHFDSVGGTEDHVYGAEASRSLAKKNPEKALNNADSFQYYMEGI